MHAGIREYFRLAGYNMVSRFVVAIGIELEQPHRSSR
jgi:hypothetical protein